MTKRPFLAPVSVLDQIKGATATGDFAAANALDIQIAEKLQAEERETGFESMSDARQVCLATFETEGYINGDGFDAFFSYMGDAMIAKVEPAYRVMGANQFADIINESASLLPGHPPFPPQETREELMEQFEDSDESPFEDLFDRFVSIGAATTERLNFIVKHADQFFMS